MKTTIMLLCLLVVGVTGAGAREPSTKATITACYENGVPYPVRGGICSSRNAETVGQQKAREAGMAWVPCEQLYGPSGQECRVNSDGKSIEVRTIETRTLPDHCLAQMEQAMRAMEPYLHLGTFTDDGASYNFRVEPGEPSGIDYFSTDLNDLRMKVWRDEHNRRVKEVEQLWQSTKRACWREP